MTTITDVSLPEGRQLDGPPVLPALWRARWRIVLCAVIAGLIGFLVSGLQPVRYTATAQLLLSDPRNAGVFEEPLIQFLDPSRYVRNQAEVAQSVPVLERTSEQIGGRLTADDIRRMVIVRPSVDLDLLTVTATDGTAAGAAELATVLAMAYQETVQEQNAAGAEATLAELRAQEGELQSQIALVEEQLSSDPDNAALQAERDAAIAQLVAAQSRADQISVDTSLFGAGVQLFEEAQVPRAPSAPQPFRNALLAGVLGALAMGGIAWWRADETALAAGRNDPGLVLGAPLLGQVPEFSAAGIDSEVPTVTHPRSSAAEAYHFLVAAMQHAMAEVGARSLVVTSARAADGKTATSLNLAIAASRDGRDVVLVDADIRARALTISSSMDDAPGIVDVARGEITLRDAATVLCAGEDLRVPLIPAGARLEDAAAFFRTTAFRRVIDEMGASADLVILDSPPLLVAADTSAIAANVDAIVLVVPRGAPIRILVEMRERLDFIGTPVIGYVFDKAEEAAGRYHYDYGYGYGPRVPRVRLPFLAARRGSSSNGDDQERRSSPPVGVAR